MTANLVGQVLTRALTLEPNHEDAKLGLKFLTLFEEAKASEGGLVGKRRGGPGG